MLLHVARPVSYSPVHRLQLRQREVEINDLELKLEKVCFDNHIIHQDVLVCPASACYGWEIILFHLDSCVFGVPWC